MYVSKRLLILIVGAALALGSVASFAAQDNGATESAREQVPAGEQPGDRGGRAEDMRPRGPAMRSEHVFPGRDGEPARTVRVDRGVVEGVEGGAFTMTQEDGTAVQVTVGADTSVIRDGARAGVGELQEGDHVVAMRIREGDADPRTVRVYARSDQRRAEDDERRAQMRERFQERRAEMEQRRAEMGQRRAEMRQRRAEMPRQWQERRGQTTL